MTDLRAVLLANVILILGFCICVTVASIHFENTSLLWWYLLSLLMSFRYSEKEKQEK